MNQLEEACNYKLPTEYLAFLLENPTGTEVAFNEYPNENPDSEGRYWSIMHMEELLETFEMKDVGIAQNFECLKLYVKNQKEFSINEWTTSNKGNIPFHRLENGFVFGEENGDYLYFDPEDNFSVWIYYHDGGDVMRVADSFQHFIEKSN